MRPLLVLVSYELTGQLVQVSQSDGHEVVKALALDGPDPAFCERVHQGCVRRCPLGLTAKVSQHRVEASPELAVPSLDQDGGALESLLVHEPEEASGLLGRLVRDRNWN